MGRPSLLKGCFHLFQMVLRLLLHSCNSNLNGRRTLLMRTARLGILLAIVALAAPSTLQAQTAAQPPATTDKPATRPAAKPPGKAAAAKPPVAATKPVVKPATQTAKVAVVRGHADDFHFGAG